MSTGRREFSLSEIDDRGNLTGEMGYDGAGRSTSPVLAGGDVDARWQDAEGGGDETAGASNATPDQGVVDEIGAAIGVTYREDEELRFGRKEAERDEHRWELDPASSEDWLERSHDRSDGSAEEVQHLAHRHRERQE